MSNKYNVNIADERSQWALIKDQATALIQSNALPQGVQNAAQAMAIIQYGRELGYLPMTALQNISLIKGKPTLSANLIGALLKNAGYKYKVTEYTADRVEMKFTDSVGESQTFDYTMAEAMQAGNNSKDNYSKYTKEMLYARCLSRGGRIVAPEVLAGVYSPEEFDTGAGLAESAEQLNQPREVEIVAKKENVQRQAEFIEAEIIVPNSQDKLIEKISAQDVLNSTKTIEGLIVFAKDYKDLIAGDAKLREQATAKKAQLVAASKPQKPNYQERVQSMQEGTKDKEATPIDIEAIERALNVSSNER